MLRRNMLQCTTALVGALLLGIVAAGSSAFADDQHLTVAIYAPNAPFESGDARYSFASKLAQHLSSAVGVPVEPKAYARAGDFEAAVKRGQVDFAVVDGVYLAERGVPWQVLATATAGGDTAARWVLIAPDANVVLDLQGRRLALVQSGGRDNAFVDNVLFDGELPKLFGDRQPAPDIAAAVTAVTLKKADATFAPESATRGQKHVFDAGRIPNPALVAIKPTVPKELVDKVRAALASAGGGSSYDGWKSASSDAYRALSGRLAARVRRPVMAEPAPISIDPLEALALPPLESGAPDLKGQFWQPPGRP